MNSQGSKAGGSHLSRRDVLQLVGVAAMVSPSMAKALQTSPSTWETAFMSDNFVTTNDGLRIFYKDWGPKTGTAHCVLAWMAPVGGRLGCPD